MGWMLWFFERQHSRLHYEVRRQTDGDNYELVITLPDGQEEIEQYTDPLALQERMERLQHSLRAEGWRPPVRRVIHGRVSA